MNVLNISETTRKAISDGIRAGIPDRSLTAVRWAEERRVLPAEAVANKALAGRFSLDITPYNREVLDCASDPNVQEVVYIASVQIGKTETCNNIVGYFIDGDPSTILYVAETEDKGKSWSVEKFQPMIDQTPSLRNLMDQRSRTSQNTMESKTFPGGHFALAYATSFATLTSRARRVVILDECEAYKMLPQGDPVDLAIKRSKTAGESRFIFMVSSPNNKENAVLLPRYQNSTAEKYFIPCPECQGMQTLSWHFPPEHELKGGFRVVWNERKDEAFIMCEHCGHLISDDEKKDAMAEGMWVPTNTEYIGPRRGFWINSLYSPFQTLTDTMNIWEESKKDKERLKTFINTELAEYWEEEERIEYADLDFQREPYAAEVPANVILLTAAVDVQDDRLEAKVTGWGHDEENWTIDYRVFQGSPAEDTVWNELREYLLRDWDGENGCQYKIKAVGVDSGYNADRVYKFCRANAGRRFIPLKGSSEPGSPLIRKGVRLKNYGLNVWIVGTDTAKDKFFSQLQINMQGPGFCHFSDALPETFFKQLCAEKRTPKFINGKTIWRWMKVSDKARNEALDLTVYNYAVYQILNPDLKSYENMLKNGKKSEKNAEKTETHEISDRIDTISKATAPAKRQRWQPRFSRSIGW